MEINAQSITHVDEDWDIQYLTLELAATLESVHATRNVDMHIKMNDVSKKVPTALTTLR